MRASKEAEAKMPIIRLVHHEVGAIAPNLFGPQVLRERMEDGSTLERKALRHAAA
jgi:hypothetical protein